MCCPIIRTTSLPAVHPACLVSRLLMIRGPDRACATPCGWLSHWRTLGTVATTMSLAVKFSFSIFVLIISSTLGIFLLLVFGFTHNFYLSWSNAARGHIAHPVRRAKGAINLVLDGHIGPLLRGIDRIDRRRRDRRGRRAPARQAGWVMPAAQARRGRTKTGGTTTFAVDLPAAFRTPRGLRANPAAAMWAFASL